MNWYFIFYLAGIADNLSGLFGGVAIASTVIMAILAMWASMAYYDGELPIAGKLAKMALISAICCGVLWAITPTKKDMMLIVAGGAVGEFVQNDEYAKQIPADVTEWLHKEIRESIADTTSVKP